MKIGLTYTGSEPKHSNYAKWIEGSDAIEVVTLSAALNNLEEVTSCEGIVLSGGVDVSPEYYSGDTTYANAPDVFNKQRDDFEAAVFHMTQELRLPVLGICRGMQLINCLYGGTLIQDLGAKNEVHRVANGLDKVHGITITAGTILHEALGSVHCAVNSAHHQAIGRIGSSLRITASSPDGVAEAMERVQAAGAPFLLCVQWHPERMYHFGLENTPASRGIRKKFLDTIKTI
ncbi:gamma-glutamyl-gamma-aminobutyrate hydrolase family protein [Niabella beijingensis]|uniref:gamma-glutamyl-gamma-aminobutyrate hydrolase family protein n=1 Tax=Niabella beijingensis TaxID=2872700 RepID=UPI001CBF970D|nr:gamma-glutamyl-gamma-aminobutyrate hydrolase family protein [Niabella beijingensis]MBZ4187964.1 gamma-glutamyl-gamma-aminobutyrate hydrolase family protein [Niabella beijingensis]